MSSELTLVGQSIGMTSNSVITYIDKRKGEKEIKKYNSPTSIIFIDSVLSHGEKNYCHLFDSLSFLPLVSNIQLEPMFGGCDNVSRKMIWKVDVKKVVCESRNA